MPPIWATGRAAQAIAQGAVSGAQRGEAGGGFDKSELQNLAAVNID